MNNQSTNKRGASCRVFTIDSKHQWLMGAAAVIAVAMLSSASLPGQVATAAGAAKAAVKPWTLPRTPDGHPDLQGIWSIATLTPLERPKEFADKPVLTEEEAAEVEKRPMRTVPTTSANVIFLERAPTVIASRRTSLIVDPPDGKVPPLTAEAQKRVEEARVQDRLHSLDGPEGVGMWERCITMGLPMLPSGYNNSIQIVQATGYVAMLREMIHDARIIPTDGRAHVPPSIRAYGGDSRGHWEGDTLVVDTTNFTDKYNYFRTRDSPREGFTPGLHVIERFTRVAADAINYEATVDDPAAFASRWTVQFPMTAIDTPVYEYACHEGNYFMSLSLSGARAEEKRASDADKKGSK
jgi:hypothetical protein